MNNSILRSLAGCGPQGHKELEKTEETYLVQAHTQKISLHF